MVFVRTLEAASPGKVQAMVTFAVHPPEVHAVGSDLCELADQLRTAMRTLSTSAAGAGKATGEFGAPAAYDTMWHDWHRQISILAVAIEELCGRTKGAAGSYRSIDARAMPPEGD